MKLIQQQEFQADLEALETKGYISKKSNILNLNPFLDVVKKNVETSKLTL